MVSSEPKGPPLAIVTGASRGIGRAIAVELARCGYFVAINYKSRADAAQETLAQVREAGGDGLCVAFDVGDGPAARACLEELLTRHGRVEVLVNNAGVVADGLFAMMPEQDWNLVLSTSLGGFYNVTRPVLNRMVALRKGSIVTISSLSGIMGNRGQTNYSAAKAGLIAASAALAKEVARLNIRVNVVVPGIIDTEMIKEVPPEQIRQMVPMRRLGRPEEVARVVRFLCSDDASYVTGAVVRVTGGML